MLEGIFTSLAKRIHMRRFCYSDDVLIAEFERGYLISEKQFCRSDGYQNDTDVKYSQMVFGLAPIKLFKQLSLGTD